MAVTPPRGHLRKLEKMSRFFYYFLATLDIFFYSKSLEDSNRLPIIITRYLPFLFLTLDADQLLHISGLFHVDKSSGRFRVQNSTVAHLLLVVNLIL